MSWIRGKLADRVGGHTALSPEKGVLVTSPGTKSSYPRLLQSLNNKVWTTMIGNFIFPTNSNSKVDTDNSTSGLRGGMGSCRHMAVGRCGSNRSISSRRDGNRISSSYYSLTIPFLMHRPNGGSGGPFDCGSNANGWYQEESPPPPNSPMGSVYQCKRCGRLGHMAQICTTPQRFEGT